MSIKKLFDSTRDSKNYLSDTDQKTAFSDIESSRNLEEINTKIKQHVPHVDYSKPENFVKYGSARLYYRSALDRIADYYPYDGSKAEINSFYNKSLDIEKYILENLYPRSNGYAVFSADGWGSKSSMGPKGYGVPATPEAIIIQGGPNAVTGELKDLMPNSTNSKFQYSNIYDEDIYRTAGLPSDYGKGTRESNLRANFDDGVTVEFWMKTGSFTDGTNVETLKQVVFDLWNREDPNANVAGGDVNKYGRITIELTGAVRNDIDYSVNSSFWTDSPFLITVQSGSVTGSYQQKIGKNITTGSMLEWNHYAITLFNSGSGFMADFHVNGHLSERRVLNVSETLGEIAPKNMVARIGSLLTASCGAPVGGNARFGVIDAGKLNGSIDEFRYWKAARTHEEIGKYWFTQVGGGANNDISNATLGVYFKFNEGVTGDSTLDSTVLDYAGRISNGTWHGYTSNSRNTGSAILSSSAASREYEDPIIRREHPDYISLESDLIKKGEFFDINNNNSMLSLVPAWIIDEEQNNDNSDLKNICHIAGAYFDKLFLQITELPKLHHATYPSSSQKPLPFAEHLAQSLGFYSPELFIDSSVLEKFTNRNEKILFESDVHDTKNLIYTNLYNNVAHIFKSKGTEKSIKNAFKCLGIDERLVKLVVNSNNQEIRLNNNYEQTLLEKSCLNFNNSKNSTAVVYQALDTNNANSRGYLTNLTRSNADAYGFTAEANIIFPHYTREVGAMDRDYDTVSLFGMYTVDDTSNASMAGTNPSFIGGNDDVANFQVYAIKEHKDSKNVYFKLSSSNKPIPFPIDLDTVLTSSVFLNTYDNQNWNISVRLKPSKYPLAKFVYNAEGNGDYTYDVIFSGYQTHLGDVLNSFSVSASISQITGSAFINAAKRMYVGAERKDLTGNVINKSDILVNGVRYWAKYLEDSDLVQHTHDVENAGISGSHRSLSPFDTGSVEIINREALALDWNFTDVTSSRADGTIGYIRDYSSGSANRTLTATDATGNPVGVPWNWLETLAGYQHSGYGYGFDTNSAAVINKRSMNSYKLTNPERAVSSDMIRLFDDNYEPFYRNESIPNYIYSIEKSFYNVVSEQIMEFFAGVIDFNSLIGAPVNRYRERYKDIENLRRTFFRRVTSVTEIEKFTEYYKWFDSSVLTIISQLLPGSAEFSDNSMNIVESHVLERNKYKSKFPTLNFESPEVNFYMKGIHELLYPWYDGSSTLPSSPRATDTHKTYWFRRAERDATEITSNNATVDAQREKFRKVVNSTPHFSESIPTFSLVDGTKYNSGLYTRRNFARTYRMSMDQPSHRNYTYSIKGGTNFVPEKDLDFVLNALRPAGPVNRENNIFVPVNVLLGLTSEMVQIEKTKNPSQPSNFISKKKRIFKVQHGRDWEGGHGYKNVDSSIGFPFNVISSSVVSGYNKAVVDSVTGGIEITNIHNDVYGPDKERPMQGTFGNHVVGGHQSRNVKLNDGTDTWLTRPEAWKILLGTCVANPSGAIGMVGPDYPSPEANEVGVRPYPVTCSQKAIYYRDFVAKRPVNIKNINTQDSVRVTTVPGNYQNQYEYIHSFGAYENPRRFVENQPTLPPEAYTSNTTSSTQIRTFLDIRRTDENHSEMVSEYSTDYLSTTGNVNKTVATTRFANPGGIETMTKGYLDFRSSEFSAYNAHNYRNLSVIKPSQGPSGTLPEPVGDGPTGIRVFDIHGKDYGLRAHLSRHTARFGRDSLHVTSSDDLPGASYTQLPGYHKIHRNNVSRLKITSTTEVPIYEIENPLQNSFGLTFGDDDSNVSASKKLKLSGPFSSGFSDDKITISAWFRRHTADNVGNGQNIPIISLGQDTGSYGSPGKPIIRFGLTSTYQLYFRVKVGNNAADPTDGYWHTTNSIMSSDSWTHVAVSYDATSLSNDPILYINAQSQSVTEAQTPDEIGLHSVNTKSPGDCFIGSMHVGSTSYPTLKSSSIDELAVYDTNLTPAEITTIYCDGGVLDLTGALAPSSSALVTWMRFGDHANDPDTSQDPATNNVFYDVKGNNNFTVVGSRANISYNPSVVQGCSGSQVGLRTVHTYATSALNNNYFIQHPIPRTDIQYAWISGAIQDPQNVRYYEHQTITNRENKPFYSDSSGRSAFYNFVVESSVGNDRAVLPGWTQPTLRINSLVVDPVSGGTNTIGFPSTNHVSSYINTTLNPDLSDTNYLNLLLTQRGDTYGWTWRKMRLRNHPVLIDERKNAVISTFTSSNKYIESYRVSPVSSRGRPALINFNNPVGSNPATELKNNVTLKATDNNERIFFNEVALNDFLNIDRLSTRTPLDQLMVLNKNPRDRLSVNWILYSQNVFPSEKNEYLSGTYNRIGYDNGFWRTSGSSRIELGSTQSASFAHVIASSSIGRSSWPLDPPENFLTRTGVFSPDVDGEYVMQKSGNAGELQNIHFSYRYGTATGNNLQISKVSELFPAALYARKHMLAAPRSVVAPTGIENGNALPGTDGVNFIKKFSVELYAGEAAWDAPKQAGRVGLSYSTQNSKTLEVALSASISSGSVSTIDVKMSAADLANTWPSSGLIQIDSEIIAYSQITNTNGFYEGQVGGAFGGISRAISGTVGVAHSAPNSGPDAIIYQYPRVQGGERSSAFQITASQPWFGTYDEFNYETSLIAKDYAIVPEYRMSEHVEDYVKYGTFNPTKTDTFEIPGVAGTANSSTSSFYKDYSNSEFMRDLLKVRQTSGLKAKEIRLVCNAAIRFNPYKGFYPAQRTLDIVGQFSRSYAESIAGTWEHGANTKPVDFRRILEKRGGVARPLMQALYSPGLMYNTIKSGIAVDYPVLFDDSKISREKFGQPSAGPLQSRKQSENNYAIVPANINSNIPTKGYNGGPWFDMRIPFEALVDPRKYINGVNFLDIEPHPSCSLAGVTASFNSQGGDGVYELMAENFFGEVPNFFLRGSEFTKLESGIVPDDLKFNGKECFGARMKIRRSATGNRTYKYDSGSTGDNTSFTDLGAKAYYGVKSNMASVNAWYPIPQDPQNARMDPNSPYRETFTMYSRPSAFGPPISGRPPSGSSTWSQYAFVSSSHSGTMDCFNGYNWAYTPPYYHGESWVDFVFRPQANKTYDLQSILAETEVRYWRVDPGMILQVTGGLISTSVNTHALIYGSEHGLGDGYHTSLPIYAGANVNDNAMQLSASFNLFGVERIAKESSDRFGNVKNKENVTAGSKWIIQPKFETPMLNFSDIGVNAITSSMGTKSVPRYGSGSVPNGMWHQFGNIPDKPDVGVFIEIDDIPKQWLKYHYDVNSTGSIYNNFNAQASGSAMPSTMKSLSSLLGFAKTNNTKRLGEIAEETRIREAVVAIPYIIEELEEFDPPFGNRDNSICDDDRMNRKRFISIPRRRIEAAIKETDGTLKGDSLEAAGESIRKLVQKMDRYVLPPQFDFLQYSNIEPFVMYMFEFEYKFDKDDLAYIWQNIAHRDYKKLTFEKQSVSHELMNMELLNEDALLGAEQLRWMVFKVKQKSRRNYYDHVADQVGNLKGLDKDTQAKDSQRPKIGFNWPYDYLSFVELINFDVDILFKSEK